MKITDVEAIVVRQPSLDGGIADGSQDDLIVRIRTDEGIEGIGEVDSSPEVVRAVVYAPTSHSLTGGLRDLLIGEDPLDIERLWQKMYRGTIFLGRRGVAIHAISGIDIALWDIKGKVARETRLGADRRTPARQGARVCLAADAGHDDGGPRTRDGDARTRVHGGEARLGPTRAEPGKRSPARRCSV